MESPWLIQTSPSTGQSAKSGEGETIDISVRPYSPLPVWATVPPSWLAISWAP